MESISDPCVFISTHMVVLVYGDACIHFKQGISNNPAIKLLGNGPENFVLATDGTMESHPSVNIERLPEKKKAMHTFTAIFN